MGVIEFDSLELIDNAINEEYSLAYAAGFKELEVHRGGIVQKEVRRARKRFYRGIRHKSLVEANVDSSFSWLISEEQTEIRSEETSQSSGTGGGGWPQTATREP